MRIEPTLRALADPTRLRIMRLLDAMELAVGELAQVLGQSQPRVSRHVRILCDAGLAERRKEGSWVFLRSAVAENRAPPMGSATSSSSPTIAGKGWCLPPTSRPAMRRTTRTARW